MGGYNNENNQQSRKRKLIFTLLSLIAILIATNGLFLYFYIKNRNTNFIGVENNKYNLLNPARKFINQKDLIINIQPFRDYLNDKYGANQSISIYFEYLPTGANISVNKDAEFWPASLLKVPTAMAVVKKIENSIWSWTNELVVMPSDKDDRFGSLYKLPTGTKITIEELIKKTLIDSDNTANYMLVRNLEPEEIRDIYEHLGLAEFFSEEGKISAKKYSVIFRALYSASYLSEENSQKLLFLMTETKFKEYLWSGLPQDAIFAHKIGISDNKKVYLDTGIIYLQNRPYLLTVMINTDDMAYAQKTMEDISKEAYNYILNYKD